MQMMIRAILGNPNDPECGVASILFPIPQEEYDHCIELLGAMEIADAVKEDCKVISIDSHYSVLKRLEGLSVNVDELDYLAKRLDSFDDGEAAQFQAMAHKLELFELKDLINLTFCCQQTTVITDFSDLNAIGKEHYMNLHGGSAPVAEVEALDGEETARLLIDSGSGTVTPYGVVYDNGMKLEQLYDGTHFPCYYYERKPLVVAMISRQEPEDTDHTVENEDGTTSEESYTVAVPITDITSVYANIENALGITITEEQKSNADSVYNLVRYGVATGADGWIEGAEVPFIGADGFCSPIGAGWESRVTSEFGDRVDPFTGKRKGHTGMDLAVPTGTPIRAALSGTVTASKYNAGGYGYYVMIDHGNGLATLYGHCSQLMVRVGQTVEVGDIVALSGSTGRSTGPHLHFEVRINGERTDPRYYLPTG